MTSSVPPSGSTNLPERLGIGPGMRVAVLHAPDGFDAALADLPEGATVQHGLRKDQRVDLILGFVPSRGHLARNIAWLVGTLPSDGAFWVAWPTPGSGVATDLDAEVVRAVAHPLGRVDAQVCAIDDDWSGIQLVPRGEAQPG